MMSLRLRSPHFRTRERQERGLLRAAIKQTEKLYQEPGLSLVVNYGPETAREERQIEQMCASRHVDRIFLKMRSNIETLPWCLLSERFRKFQDSRLNLWTQEFGLCVLSEALRLESRISRCTVGVKNFDSWRCLFEDSASDCFSACSKASMRACSIFSFSRSR